VLQPADFIRLAVDPLRLAVLGRAATGTVDAAAVAADAEVPEGEVWRAIGRLREAGLLDAGLRLDPLVLREIARSLPTMEVASPTALEGDWTAEEVQILTRFFSGDRLQSIPSVRAKRIIVLERLAQEFEPGLRYSEQEVNFTLQLFHADYAALRRYLVDEGLLTRADGVYWRTGGRT
jgi:hypothetical protein